MSFPSLIRATDSEQAQDAIKKEFLCLIRATDREQDSGSILSRSLIGSWDPEPDNVCVTELTALVTSLVSTQDADETLGVRVDEMEQNAQPSMVSTQFGVQPCKAMCKHTNGMREQLPENFKSCIKLTMRS